jgi:glyoxylase-like metal-dependent hydrolase (beta-lactamase superfamily II)
MQDWFDSLRKLRAGVPEDVLVLPSHGKPFRGAYTRIDAIIREHEERLEALVDVCKEPHRAVDVFPALYRAKIDDRNRIMATGEALSHLHLLVKTGDLVREHRDGCNWYQTS